SYDSNDFIRGMSTEQWNGLNEDEKQPMYNRFRQTWCPGSSFKPVIASIGLKTGTIDPGEDFGNEGLSWQKDASWGSYHVTTLHAYEPVIMKNALIYSDNIYFAKAALKIGADTLMHSLDELEFNQEIPFDIVMSKSQYSNEGKIESEIQLADSGYGQGQILVNPLHLASIYTSFVNNGDVIKPYLRYQEDAQGEVWISQAFDPDIAAQVTEGMRGVVNDPNGTGYAAHRDDIALVGKTGTAEIKDSVEDTEGTEIGWFAVFTENPEAEKPILIVSMVENVKGLGGSGYVVNKDKAVLDGYLAR
ncbi:MAG: penicillin-binding transpeptidase domain-containing protein, partial [Lachnospiraceae bacterium]|nr:penicillin-binding transpeptidase domain-containing protein [Lachnospiraceae bacterium]